MIAVTAVGAISALGNGAPALFDGLCAGRSGIADGPFSYAGPAASIPGGLHLGSDLALAAVREALAGRHPSGMGLVGASTAGDMVRGEVAYRDQLLDGVVSDDFLWAQLCDRPTAVVAERLGFDGPRLTVSNACSSGTVAVGIAAGWIRSGRLDAVMVFGVDALCELTVRGFGSLGLISSEACRPFDRQRSGISLGEGAGALLLERVGEPLAWLTGYGNATDAHHMTAPHPEGRGLRAAMAQLGAIPAGTYINAHGTGTVLNDASEAAVLQGMGPVSSSKGAIGHTLGAAGALEAVISVLALHRGVAPPNVGVQDPEFDLDLVREARAMSLSAALSVNAAFGGSCAALLLRSS